MQNRNDHRVSSTAPAFLGGGGGRRSGDSGSTAGHNSAPAGGERAIHPHTVHDLITKVPDFDPLRYYPGVYYAPLGLRTMPGAQRARLLQCLLAGNDKSPESREALEIIDTCVGQQTRAAAEREGCSFDSMARRVFAHYELLGRILRGRAAEAEKAERQRSRSGIAARPYPVGSAEQGIGRADRSSPGLSYNAGPTSAARPPEAVLFKQEVDKGLRAKARELSEQMRQQRDDQRKGYR